jgi:ketosteroid isomerase-like protein
LLAAAVSSAALSCAGKRDSGTPESPPKVEPVAPVAEEEPEPPPDFTDSQWWDALFSEFNAAQFEQAAARFADPVQATTVGMPAASDPSRANLIAGWEQARAMLPDNRMQAERVFVVDNVAYAQVVTVGTHTGDIEGFPASGKPVGWYSLFRMQFDDEKLANELTIYTNPLVFAVQAGAVSGAADVPVPSLPETESTPMVLEPGDTANSALVKVWYTSIGEGSKSMRAALGETFDEGVVVHETYAGASHEGIDWLRTFMNQLMSATKNNEQTDLEVHSVGDFVIVHGLWKARRTRALPGVGGRGKEYEYDFADVYRFADRKVVEAWWYRNPQQVIDQLSE